MLAQVAKQANAPASRAGAAMRREGSSPSLGTPKASRWWNIAGTISWGLAAVMLVLCFVGPSLFNRPFEVFATGFFLFLWGGFGLKEA